MFAAAHSQCPAMSACAPTADVSLQRGDRRFGPKADVAADIEQGLTD
jgi:hypothetical protein